MSKIARFRLSISLPEAILVALMSWIVLICIRPVPSSLWTPWRAKQPAMTDFDPPLGTRVEFPRVDIFGEQFEKGAKLLVYAGNCSSCSLNSLKPEYINAPSTLQVVVVYSAPESEIPKRLGKGNPQILVLADPTAKIEKLLNAAWSGRAYIVDSSGRLEWIAGQQGVWPDGVSYGR